MKKFMFIASLLTLNLVLTNMTGHNSVETATTQRMPASAVKKVWSFNYKDLSKKPFQIKKEATTYEEAYKSASRDCFQRLTGDKYPGEEKGLDIIDICANPKS